MKFANIELRHGVMLAPMAGFSDRAMRLVASKFGAEYSVTEMVSAKAIVYGDKKTAALAKIENDEGKVAIQIFGSDPDVMAKAAEIISKNQYGTARAVAIDINMGCPVRKVFSSGDGSALMANPKKIYEITRAVSQNTDIPTTVKIRAGIDDENKNAVLCALMAERGGASLVTVHGRTRTALYTGKVDLDIIKDVKTALKIPVIANGDILDAISAKYTLEYTGADGIMIGRAAIGNPFIFSEIISSFENKSYTPPSLQKRCDTALFQLRIAIENKGEEIAVREARGQIAQYMRAFCGASRLRAEINQAKCYSDVEMALENAKNAQRY
jgi:tRNA-dihydrouridine synthase B